MGKPKVPQAALDMARQAAGDIRRLEAEAASALHEAGDTAGHRKYLTDKCLTLEALSEEAADVLADADTDGVTAFTAGLEDFARRAGMALSLESIFFMGALLYPEEYQDGDLNDLERFIDRFEAA
ncbi:conserved hypothetical protein [Solidesulfovibrio fructosivorans JJ]]|uniref:Uncharacterized protein n=1 Tax=Solidesulfovibrio fructosivorans JJ] TaxID=596151 RepID=E1JZY3_SOLFR|nr:hypothetical protein [Solidesulfovibrio fructosivorans]EFL50078.1 conserved hypothetical protein [Solidesulfovibrio fructosivorans JJ]]